PIEHELTPIRDGTQEAAMGTVCVFRDISERRRMRDRERLLAAASSEMSSSLDREFVLTRATSLIARDWTDWCVIHLMDDQERLRVGACAHRDKLMHAVLARLAGAAVHEQAATQVGRVVQSGQPLRVNDVIDGTWPARGLGISAPVADELAAVAA